VKVFALPHLRQIVRVNDDDVLVHAPVMNENKSTPILNNVPPYLIDLSKA
jgi:hypothetical protein